MLYNVCIETKGAFLAIEYHESALQKEVVQQEIEEQYVLLYCGNKSSEFSILHIMKYFIF